MSEPNSLVPQHGSLFWRFYIIIWLGLAGIAISYILMSVNLSDFHLALAHVTRSETKQTERPNHAKVIAEIESLRDTVKNLKQQLKNVEKRSQDTVLSTPKPYASNQVPEQSSGERAKNIASKAHQKTSESQFQMINNSKLVAKPDASLKKADRTKIDDIVIPPLPHLGLMAKRAAATSHFDQNAQQPMAAFDAKPTDNIVTGSITPSSPSARSIEANPVQPSTSADPVVVFGTPTVVAENSSEQKHSLPAAAVISSASSLNDLRLSWRQFVSLYPSLLGKLEPRYDFMGSSNAPYRLLTGPLSNQNEANQLCAALAARNVNCSVGEYIGNAL